MTKKIKQQIKQNLQPKQQDSSTQKVLSFLSKIFLGQAGIQKQINRSIVSNTYFSILEIINTVLLFAVFNKSNSVSYSLFQSAIGGYFFLVCLIPRVSKKHVIFQITFALYVLGTIGSGLSFILLFNNFSIFSFYCSELSAFYFKKSVTEYPAKSICQTVYQMYITEIITETIILGLRFVYLIMCFKAYIVAQEKYDEEEKKKRRRDRYNQLLMKRTMYDQKRKT